MLKQIKTLTRLQLCNLYGKNVFRYTKDKNAKLKSIAISLVMLLLFLMIAGYIGGIAYAYSIMGLQSIVPAYVIMLSSIFVFLFATFKAGGVLFQKNAYEIISSLPVSKTAIVISRFIRLYVEELMLSLVIMLSGLGVYAYMNKPSVSFYIIAAVTVFTAPLLPIIAAVIVGTIITGISSRVKQKGIISALLSMLLLGGYFLGMSKLTNAGLDGELTEESLEKLADIVAPMIGKIYPPAVLLGDAMLSGDYLKCGAAAVVILVLFALTVAVVSAAFHSICRSLFSSSAKHNYKMQQLKSSSVMWALYKRELKRYLASGVYITNTIINPIMALAVAVGVCFMDMSMFEQLPINIDVIGLLPFVLGAAFCLMPTTSSSVSLEGKEWWIYKSLPLRAKDIFGGKMLLNISINAPFYVIAEIVIAVMLKPTLNQMLWLIVIPALCIVFDSVFGITVNLLFPVFNWENETVVVKQSASAGVGMLGLLVPIICAVPALLVTQIPADLVKLAICAVLIAITAVLNGFNNSKDLKNIG